MLSRRVNSLVMLAACVLFVPACGGSDGAPAADDTAGTTTDAQDSGEGDDVDDVDLAARSILSQVEARAGRLGPAQVSDAFSPRDTSANRARDGGAHNIDTGDGTLGWGSPHSASLRADLAIDFPDVDLLSQRDQVVEMMAASGLTEHRHDHTSSFDALGPAEYHTFWDPDELVFCDVGLYDDYGDIDCVTGERRRHVIEAVVPAVRAAFEEQSGWTDYTWYSIDYFEARDDPSIVGGYIEAGDDGPVFLDHYYVDRGDGWEFVYDDPLYRDDYSDADAEACYEALTQPDLRGIFDSGTTCL